MNTIAWVIVLAGMLITYGASRGRGLSRTFGDLGDAFQAAIDNDSRALREALTRTGNN